VGYLRGETPRIVDWSFWSAPTTDRQHGIYCGSICLSVFEISISKQNERNDSILWSLC